MCEGILPQRQGAFFFLEIDGHKSIVFPIIRLFFLSLLTKITKRIRNELKKE